jgi:hypothetical protein
MEELDKFNGRFANFCSLLRARLNFDAKHRNIVELYLIMQPELLVAQLKQILRSFEDYLHYNNMDTGYLYYKNGYLISVGTGEISKSIVDISGINRIYSRSLRERRNDFAHLRKSKPLKFDDHDLHLLRSFAQDLQDVLELLYGVFNIKRARVYKEICMITDIKAAIELIKEGKSKLGSRSLEKKILSKVDSEEILICPFCSGFGDIDEPRCLLCHESIGVFGKTPKERTIAISLDEFDDSKVISHRNEGIYCGRYSRNQEIVLDN